MTFSRPVCPEEDVVHVLLKYVYHLLEGDGGFIYNIFFVYMLLQ